MKVFIENEAGSDQKMIYDETTLEFKKTMAVSRPYPFPYGFILGTTGEDGDKLDCFVITDQALTSGQIIDCEPIGLMEQYESAWDPAKNGVEEQDHNVLAVIAEEGAEIDDEVKTKLREFILHVFDHLTNKRMRVGNFLGQDESVKYIDSHSSN